MNFITMKVLSAEITKYNLLLYPSWISSNCLSKSSTKYKLSIIREKINKNKGKLS